MLVNHHEGLNVGIKIKVWFLEIVEFVKKKDFMKYNRLLINVGNGRDGNSCICE